ncbi:endosulfine alpha b [Notolabrus celidotus]|uniref:endosulfine alpha b n=1 Tax=Notolabrus celidotus TaxID=1203425 RepID=UPI00148F9E1B|nr:endosulfine alpha b [Notolabrus celidotus]
MQGKPTLAADVTARYAIFVGEQQQQQSCLEKEDYSPGTSNGALCSHLCELSVERDTCFISHTHTMSTENLDSDTQVDYEDEKQDCQEKNANPVKAEEAKLKAKYPQLNHKPGGSEFLMKRLQKGPKYFDSGDYNMAKAKMKNKQLPVAGPDKNLVTGDHIPTPQDLPQRKSSLVTSKLAG